MPSSRQSTCPFLISSETKEPKPRTLVTSSLEPKSYYLYLYNVPKNNRLVIGSDNTEAVTLTLGLTVYPFTNAPAGRDPGRSDPDDHTAALSPAGRVPAVVDGRSAGSWRFVIAVTVNRP